MEAPGFFLLVAAVLFLLFAACMVTGVVWLLFGWRKQARSVQILSALPFGIGLLIIGPLLLLAFIMVGLWLVASLWGGSSQPTSPPASQVHKRPNHAASGNGTLSVAL